MNSNISQVGFTFCFSSIIIKKINLEKKNVSVMISNTQKLQKCSVFDGDVFGSQGNI